MPVTRTRKDPYLDRNSIEFRFRAKRFEILEKMIRKQLNQQSAVRILDIGGTEKYWSIASHLFEEFPDSIDIHILNLEDTDSSNIGYSFTHQIGDACDPEILAGEYYDIVHSNSVIEHVGDWVRMEAFSRNIIRLGQEYFIQTPHYWFPLEPHFRFPGFQWLPPSVRTRLLQKSSRGFYPREPNYLDARKVIDSIRLLTPFEVSQLFQNAKIEIEKVFGLSKSIVAVGKGQPQRIQIKAPPMVPNLDTLSDFHTEEPINIAQYG